MKTWMLSAHTWMGGKLWIRETDEYPDNKYAAVVQYPDGYYATMNHRDYPEYGPIDSLEKAQAIAVMLPLLPGVNE